MFPRICKTILSFRSLYNSVTPHYNPSSSMVLSLSLVRYFSSNADDPHCSFTLSYLTQTCGLSPKSALSASKIVQFESSEQPDSVLSCFQRYGFSKSHISELITKYPRVLHCNPDKTISPKVDFFLSKGVSTSEIVRIFSVNPHILRSSLENTLVRNSNILIEIFQSEDKVIQVIKQNPYALYNNPEAALIPNVNSLRENGVTESNILWLIRNHWLCIGSNPIKFEKIVEEVKQLGFSPLKLQFVIAITVLSLVTKPKWDGRVKVYKKWGWSDEDITTAFKKYPLCMIYSVDNIADTIDFYVNKMGLDSSIIVNRPRLLSYSLKKRLIPRGAAMQYLFSKGLVKLDSSLTNMFELTDKRFIEKLVNYGEEAPHLLELYNDKLHEATSRTS